MKRLIYIIIFLLLLTVSADAKSIEKALNKIISDSGIPKSSISISVRNADNGRSVYKLNENMLMHPASVQKALTIVPIYETLGDDYQLKTELYSRGKNAYVIKLGADPYLNSSELRELISKINSSAVNQIYIDDSIIEKKDWGEGWQWDDDLNSSMPRFNTYNIDNNTYKITIMPTELNHQAKIINCDKAPVAFINNIKSSDKNNIEISRNNITAPNMITLNGTVNTPVTKFIPSNNLKRNFEYKLTGALEDRHIYLKSAYRNSKLEPKDIKKAEVNHDLKSAIHDILINSNNMSIETLAKIASNKKYNTQGTDLLGIRNFYDYCDKIGLDYSKIRITDSSGVSKNNLMSTDFITDFLFKNKDNPVMNYLPVPGQGTLSVRMLPLKNNLKAKTGTLSDISSIAGYLKTKNGENYVFSIIINDPSSVASDKKSLEDYIIRELYFSS